MDHRVSKDMISSGMTPSGQKTQADLGRTQYGSAPSPNSLMDAYHSMYVKEKEETLEEGKIPSGLQAYLDKKKGKKGKKEVKEGNINELKTRTMLDYIDKASDSASKELGKAEKTTSRKKEAKARLKMDKRERGIEMAKDKIMKRAEEDVDLFDLVKGKLIDEGYEEKEALKIMANMNKEEFEKVSEGLAGLAIKTGLAVGGAALAKKGIGDMQKKFNKSINKQRNTSPIGGNKRVDDVRSGSGDPGVGQKINY